MEKWAELRTAYQVAKLGTVNRHIDVLEAELGARIFIRHARGYTLTELGQEVLRVAQKTEALIDDLAGRLQGKKAPLSGEITLNHTCALSRFVDASDSPVSPAKPKLQRHGMPTASDDLTAHRFVVSSLAKPMNRR